MLLKDAIVEGLLDGKANNVICLDMRNIDGSICDYFVIGHGDSATHIEGINRAVYKKCMKELKEKPWKEEGKENNEWILMDYVNVWSNICRHTTIHFLGLKHVGCQIYMRGHQAACLHHPYAQGHGTRS